MSEMFKAVEILKTAVRIEENGIVFYRAMLERFKEKNVQDIFNFLADEDERHRKIFGGSSVAQKHTGQSHRFSLARSTCIIIALLKGVCKKKNQRKLV